MDKVLIQRISRSKDDTIGAMYLNGKFQGFTMEDEHRKNKVSGETRIPAGHYKLGLRKVVSPLTKEYREKFGFFDYHLEIKGIPNFDYVYIHIGNTDEDTAGCPLIGRTAQDNVNSNGFIGYSTEAYERFYRRVRPLVGENEIDIVIQDENTILE